MKRYFIIIPKNDLTDNIKELLLTYNISQDGDSYMGMIFSENIPEDLNQFTILTRDEYNQLLINETEKWVPEKFQ